MAFELDHLFIWTRPGAAVAERLLELGIREGPPNRHPGQGTANRRFFFANVMLELLWVDEPAAGELEPARATGLHRRWRLLGRGASPFGVCLRPAGAETGLPFPCWDYRPRYLPAGRSIGLDRDRYNLRLPFLFYLDFGRRPDAPDGIAPEYLRHPAGISTLDRVRIDCPGLDPAAPAVVAANRIGGLCLRVAAPPLMWLEFDRGRQGRSAELAPDLPLSLRW